MDNFDVLDIWRYLHPNIRRFTCRQPNPLIQCRLDYFLISNNLIEYVTKADIVPGLRTDHSGITWNVQLQKDPVRGPGHWKFNNSYLNEDDYVNDMNKNLDIWLNDDSLSDPQAKWEWIKYKVRNETMKYAKKKCVFRRDRIKELSGKLNSLEKSLANDPSQDTLNEINSVKSVLEELDTKIIDGIIVRSRIRWAEKVAEADTKYTNMMDAASSAATSCHFDWNLYPDGSRDCKSVIETVNTKSKHEPGFMTIPALLFRAFLFMSDYSRPNDLHEANKSLVEAGKEIGKLEKEDARIGYSIVHQSLASVIRGEKMHDANEKKRRIQEVSELQKKRTTKTDAYIGAYIDVTRAFALARLGPTRVDECVTYFKKATDAFPQEDKKDKAELLVHFGISFGRFARVQEGIPKDVTNYTEREREMYEKALQLNDEHVLANLYYGVVLSHENKQDKAQSYFEKALMLDPENMKVLDHATRYYRKRKQWEKALSCVDTALKLKQQECDPMLYHQLSLIYLRKYQGINRKQPWYVNELPEETEPKSLLPLALKAINDAIKLDDAALFHTTRASIYEELSTTEDRKTNMEKAKEEYGQAVTRVHNDTPTNNVKIFFNYGRFLLRYDEHDKVGIDYLRKGIDTAVKWCTETTANNTLRFQGQVYWECSNAIEKFEKCILEQLEKNVDDSNALKNLGWLIHLVGDMQTLYTRSSALEYYEKAKTCPDNDQESRREILQGLIDCHLKRGQETDFKMAGDYVRQLSKINTVEGRIKTADWKLAEGRHALAIKDFRRARSLFLEAVDVGSFEACRHMINSIYSNPADLARWATMWRFRKDCARIIHCLEDRDDVLSMTRKMAGLSLHNVTEDEKHVDRAAKEDAIKMVNDAMKLEDGRYDKTRKAHFELEKMLLIKPPVKEKEIIDMCEKVLSPAREMLDHVVAKFGRKHYPSRRASEWYSAYPYFNQGYENVDAELQKRLEGEYGWRDFKKKFRQLHDFLVQVQPATDPATYKWVSAMANLTNVDKHKEFVDQLEPELEIGKHPDGTKRIERFNLVELAQNASEGVEEIVNEFYKYM
ncbi:uncharacterized protein [Amphiura filiformis]|uniref:uncharacterized protein n=1 Tax=Amphiura filiformis TaxID=82378 RepID=UPI003B20ECFD